MLRKNLNSLVVSRRGFLKATAVAVGAAALPFSRPQAQGAAKYRRLNVSDPKATHKATRVLDSYKKAIRAMLALPPTNPRNWYRNALVHTLDCPHGNWWFLVWHRAYLGWFEQTCRELSGDPDFALPYWDWTAEPRIPAAMFDDVLDPNNAGFIARFDDFKTKFEDVVAKADYWKRNWNPGDDILKFQYGQLLTRGIRFPKDLWFDIIDNPMGKFFFDQPLARGLTKGNPDLDRETKDAVALKTIYPALASRDFITFGSSKAGSHHRVTGSGVLESLPHNLVHNCIGTPSGFMYDFLSPVDPIFFLHHANIDRLWDVWTRKQKARGNPILPDGYLLKAGSPEEKASDYHKWSTEPFLFFINSKGQPVSETNAGNYAEIGAFDYDYQPGSGEDVVPLATAASKSPAAPVQSFSASIAKRSVTTATPGSGAVKLPPALLEPGATGRRPTLLAKITLDLPPLAHARYKVVVNGPAEAAGVGPSSPFYAGTLSMFGHHVMQAPFMFTVPLSASIAAMRANNLLLRDAPLNIRIIAEAMVMPREGGAYTIWGRRPRSFRLLWRRSSRRS